MKEAERLAQLVAHQDPGPRVIGIIVEPLRADQSSEARVIHLMFSGH